jgi:hypothetical protein
MARRNMRNGGDGGGDDDDDDDDDTDYSVVLVYHVFRIKLLRSHS